MCRCDLPNAQLPIQHSFPSSSSSSLVNGRGTYQISPSLSSTFLFLSSCFLFLSLSLSLSIGNKGVQKENYVLYIIFCIHEGSIDNNVKTFSCSFAPLSYIEQERSRDIVCQRERYKIIMKTSVNVFVATLNTINCKWTFFLTSSCVFLHFPRFFYYHWLKISSFS